MRPLVIRWACLLLLLAVTVGAAFLPLGAANMAVALAVSFAMAGTIVLTCMRLGTAPKLATIFAISGLCWFAVLLTLGGIDYGTRTIFPNGSMPTTSR